MRYLYTLLLLTLFGLCHANDTLTRAEIYNYNIGDTFDYRIYDSQNGGGSEVPHYINISYERYVITDIQWGPDSLSKTIYKQKLFPLPSSSALYLDKMNESEIDIVISENQNPSNTYTSVFSSSSLFMGRQINYLNCFCSGGTEHLYAKGLGVAIYRRLDAYASVNWDDSTVLIYYSNTTEHLGTPYTEQPTAIHEQEKSVFKVYPNLVSNEFWIEMEKPSEQSNVLIYNLQGQQILQQQLQGNKTKIDIHNLPIGVYVWKVFKGSNFMGAGKVLKEN